MAILAMINLALLIANFLFVRRGKKDPQSRDSAMDSLTQPQR
jgi:hypothetical protein